MRGHDYDLVDGVIMIVAISKFLSGGFEEIRKWWRELLARRSFGA